MNRKLIITAIILAITTFTATKVKSQMKSLDPIDTTSCDAGWLWEISGNGLTQKSYLFGTCHWGICSYTYEDVFGFRGVDGALSNVKAIYFETDLTVSKRLAAKEISIAEFLGCNNDTLESDLMPDGVNYESLFDSIAQYQEVHQFLTQKMGDAEYWKKTPIYWFHHLSGYNLAKGYYGVQAVEGVLSTEAVKRDIEIGQLEDLKQHAQWLSRPHTRRQPLDIPLKTQATMLYIAIHHNEDNQMIEPLKIIAMAYLENDTCCMHNVLESQRKKSTLNKEVLHTSAMNKAWLPVIVQNIAQRPCMIAVGARHLLGSNSLIAMLRKKGYTVESVKNK
ncbi:MAG: TraB/GumN family protein [Prevotella sp.]|nr:TraB/GumN family protein [Prevotella sp.]